MGRAPCCDKANVKKGPWSPEEDARLKSYIEQHGTGGNWIALPHKIGLKRCGKSCRLRWLNYLRPNIKHGGFSEEEDRIILSLYISIGSRWSIIAAQLPGRTDNDIKNYWNTRLKKKLFGKQSRKDHSHQARRSALLKAAAAATRPPDAAAALPSPAAVPSSLPSSIYNHAWPPEPPLLAMPVHPVDGSVPSVDEAIRSILYKAGATPFPAPPSVVYDDPSSFVPSSLPTIPLQGIAPPPAPLEMEESFHFNQVKLDGLDCFFHDHQGGGGVLPEYGEPPAAACPSLVQDYWCLLDQETTTTMNLCMQ